MSCLFHKWEGCKCLKCGKTRNEGHDWNGCKCEKCGLARDEGHIWKECKCEKCGKIREGFHKWVEYDKGIVQCSLCETKMIKIDYFGIDATKRSVIAMLTSGVLMKLNISDGEMANELEESIKKGLITTDDSFTIFLLTVKLYKQESAKISKEEYSRIIAKAKEINDKLSLGLSFDSLTED